jgi:rRNA maturation endonuclease Nob1
MPKKALLCDECGSEFTLTYKKESGEPKFCPMCGEELDLGWNASEEDEEL